MKTKQHDKKLKYKKEENIMLKEYFKNRKREKQIKKLEAELTEKLYEATKVGFDKEYRDKLCDFYCGRIYRLNHGEA